MKKRNWIKSIGHFVLYILVFIFILLFFSYLWAKANYGNIGLDEIIFHLNMPLQGTADTFIFSYIKTALIPAVALFAVFWLLFHCPSGYVYHLKFQTRKRSGTVQIFPLRFHAGICTIGLIAGCVLLVLMADQTFGFFDFVSNQIHRSTFIEEVYVDPANAEIQFPEQKRNLIWIFVESSESSAQDKENGGLFDRNCIPEMTQIAKDNISFSQSDLIEGASVAPACGWTIAGLVAQTSGLPLKLYRYSDKNIDNSMKKYEYFLPGATSLGDILEENGYHNFFMAGSDFKFGGRTNYFTQHGNYEIWDYVSAKKDGAIPQDYKVWWGFEDAKLYTFAKEKLLALAAEDQPFNFQMLTVDTHHQNGYVCDICPHIFEDQYSDVWACASLQLSHFIEWIKQQDFYENTTIIITGDHCSMDTDFYGEFTYEKHYGETVRKVYNAIINNASSSSDSLREKNRKFTTLDFFPTALSSIGAEITGDRLGLGTDLFSDSQTLAEEYGYEYLFQELNKKSTFYNNELLYP